MSKLFAKRAPWVMGALIKDFGFTVEQAAGILGNIGHECAGFTKLHEVGQPEGRGGYGWCQWNGPRRQTFMAWCEDADLPWESSEANYGYLKAELESTYGDTVGAVLKAKGIKEAVRAFERNFERAGVVSYMSRERWANLALKEYNKIENSIK